MKGIVSAWFLLTDDNWITFNTWGEQFTGRLVKTELKGEGNYYYHIDLVANPGGKNYKWVEDGGGFAFPEKKFRYILVSPSVKKKKVAGGR